MATESATVNGLYDGQFSQPAELAASTPSHAPSASQSSTTAGSTQQAQKADPQEIGWYFVEQYYTTLSKSPERIHLFYNKKSQLVTGREAEKVVPAVGVKAINEKIKSLDIHNCKVRVLNVDSQSSFDNIVVQVIGQMSNKSEPHHKFVQTFILATQPNGYYVLNDIFRYLDEDEHEIIEDEVPPAAPVKEEASAVEQPVTEQASVSDNLTTHNAVEQVDEKLEQIKPQPAGDEPEVNGAEDDVPEAEQEHAGTSAAGDDDDVIVPTETAAAAGSEKPLEPEPTPAQTPPPAAAPTSDVPLAKKTWANMVGTKAPAIPALPQQTPASSTTPPTQPKARTTVPAQAPKTQAPSQADPAGDASSTTSAAQSNGWQTADHGKKTKGQQPKAQEGNVYAYIKNVNEKIDARELRSVLEKYGELKYYDVSRPKQCAFVEFVEPAGYTAAVAANPHTVGGETINVEERRPRPGAYGNNQNQYARGGSTTGNGGGPANRGRGGNMQQRSGSQGGGYNREAVRGGPAQRGGRPAGAVNKTRGGQSQAA